MNANKKSHAPLCLLEIAGNSRRRGEQHGQLLREPIARAVEFYRSFFHQHLHMTPSEMRQRASRYLGPTAAMNPLLVQEWEGIAEGSGQVLEDVVALTARYEITFERVKLGECSNVFVGPQRSADGQSILGMNWEWRPEVMDFRAVITARCDDMPDHIVVTECGQPGKYGLNAEGIAAIETGMACSTAHSVGRQLFALVIRNALSKVTLDAAQRAIRDNPPEATISFFLADASGRACNIEAMPNGLAERELGVKEIAWHTNHSLLTQEPCSFEDSRQRGERWKELVAEHGAVTWETVGRWLADRKNGAAAICKHADPSLARLTTYLQTLSSIVLLPRERAIWVSDGPSSENPYRRFALNTRNKGNHVHLGTSAKSA
jgi:hypothetical protein